MTNQIIEEIVKILKSIDDGNFDDVQFYEYADKILNLFAEEKQKALAQQQEEIKERVEKMIKEAEKEYLIADTPKTYSTTKKDFWGIKIDTISDLLKSLNK